jgi:hypothetical protein
LHGSLQEGRDRVGRRGGALLRHQERLDRNPDGQKARTETVSAMFSSGALQFLYEGAAKVWKA